MKNSNALRMWGLCMFAMTVCLLALLVQDQVNSKAEQEVILTVDTTSTTSTSTSTSTSTTTTTTTTIPEPVVVVQEPAQQQDHVVFFDCIRWRESRNNYSAVSESGTFMGAYQIYQQGWDKFAQLIGREDLVGVQPHAANPSDQDAVALVMYQKLGSKPWNGACA